MSSHTNTIFSNSAFTSNKEGLGIQFFFYSCLISQLVQNLGERNGTDWTSLESNYPIVFSSRDPFRTKAPDRAVLLHRCSSTDGLIYSYLKDFKFQVFETEHLNLVNLKMTSLLPPREIFFPGSINKPIDLMQPTCFAQHHSYCDKGV